MVTATVRSVRLRVLRSLGGLLNTMRVPGFVREATYVSARGAKVCVRISSLFTVVSVDGFEIFFYRLSGGIDGVSMTEPPDYMVARIPSRVRGSERTAHE
jgi:hypothetical protein